ncbi:MAG TPA: glycosyltransferase family 4 protein, partial [Verrucomicrobiota bacterium]|nr:glycosyltransferase family 4 protein [Verrucomicrobiota bacterium]
MKVLHLNTMLRGGGTDDQCIKVVAGLRSLGVDARIMGPGKSEFSSQLQSFQIPQIATPPEGPLKIHFMRAVAREIHTGDYDIVHAHHGRDYWPTFLSVALSLRRPKIVFTRHLAKSPRSLPSRFFLLRLCDRVIAVSEFTRRVMKEGFNDPDSPEPERHYRPRLLGDTSKISVIPCCIDTERFYPQPPSPQLLKEWNLGPDHFIFAVVGGYDHPRGKGQREYL